jgi:acetylglutamate/LysW-gamma-L-alpha-aminoadipate kinase
VSELCVVKLGGSVELSDSLVAELAERREPLVLIHGGHRELDSLGTRLGHPPRMVRSSRGEVARYTDSVAMDHFLMAYCGLRNKRIVEQLRRAGVDAVGLSALDGGIAVGERREHLRVVDGDRKLVLRGNYTGSIEHIDASLLRLLLDAGRLPVLCPPAQSTGGEAINVDGDRLAAEVAVALGAASLVILMDMPGLLRDVTDPASVVPSLSVEAIEQHLDPTLGRARAKLEAARRAVRGGVARVVLASGGVSAPLAAALSGEGTTIV